MPALLYLALCIFSGYTLCTLFLPVLKAMGEKSFSGREINLSSYLYLFPAYFLTGTLFVTWAVYLLALVFSVTGCNTADPLAYANPIIFFLFLLFDGVMLWLRPGRKFSKPFSSIFEALFFLLLGLFITYLMFLTFYVKDGVLHVGYSVFSDFAPHLGMIRSFSYGNNFPTWYSHFAGEDIRYHFMFQFLAGNLEYLGLPIDWAFNLPSILSMWSAGLLLYVLAVKITGKRPAGFLSVLFFLFRSSPSFFRYLAALPKGTDYWEALTTQTEFISYTSHEDWGLWNLNVYCNQRHLAFGIGIMLLALLLFMPYLYRMYSRIRKWRKTEDSWRGKLGGFFGYFLLSKEALSPMDVKLSIFMGLVLGGLAFWNGAVLIACLLVLFVMALASAGRLDYLVTALIAMALSILQSALFIKGSALSPSFYFGFLADNKTLMGVFEYMLELWGVLFILALTYLFLAKGVKRYLTAAFFAPLAFALTVSLTVDISVNHKYIMISALLLSIIIASLVLAVWEKKRLGCKLLALLLTLAMTATGLFDLTVIIKRNENHLTYDLNDPVTLWIRDNATSRDIFLTSNYSLHRVVMGGAMLYDGWPYYAWSAGYDTAYRDEQVKKMYEAESSQELTRLAEENNIRYIIVDMDARTNADYTVREDVISSTFQAVYTEGEGDWLFTIYDTSLAISQ